MKSEIAKRIMKNTPQHTKDFVKMYGDAKVATSDDQQTGTNTLVMGRSELLLAFMQYLKEQGHIGYGYQSKTIVEKFLGKQ